MSLKTFVLKTESKSPQISIKRKNKIKHWTLPVNFPSESGIFPVSLFRSKCNASRLVKSPIDGGISPVRSLNDKSRNVKVLILLRNEGTGPDKLVQLSLSVFNRVSLVMAIGIWPVRFVSLRKTRVSRYGKSPTAAGIWPEMLPEKIVRELTRLVCGSQSSAYQVQQSVCGFHEAKW